MKSLLLCVTLIFTQFTSAAAESPVTRWNDDYAAASKTGRPMLLNFTGTDWCVWCHRLRDEVFQTPFFNAYAADSLALVELDFPRNKKLSPQLQMQNDNLAKKFGVRSYPTVILLGPDGTEWARLGYMQGGPKTFVRELKRLIAAAQNKAE